MPWISGRSMKFIFSSRDRGAGCGFHQRIRTQSYFITLREKAWGTSERSACGTADWCFVANPSDLTERPSGNSCGTSGKRLSSLDGE
jgi:hypothetical protein